MDDQIKPQDTIGTINGSIMPDGQRVESAQTVAIVMPQEQIEPPIEDTKKIWAPNGALVEYDGEMPMLEELLEITANHPGGRPCEYCAHSEKVIKDVEEYLEQIKAQGKAGIPFIEELAIKIGVDDTTLVSWANKKLESGEPEHPEFLAAYKKLKTYQKMRLLQRTLGRYNPTGAIFQLKANHGLMETEKKVLAGDANDPLEIIIIEEDRKKDGE